MKIYFTADGVGLTFLGSTLTIGTILLTIVALANHQVTNYYVDSLESLSNSGGSCVYANNPWEPDTRVYCSTDPAKVFDYAIRANELLKSRR